MVPLSKVVPSVRRHSARAAYGALLGAGCVIWLLGCGGSDSPETVAVSGSVTYQGSPLTNGKVMFNPVDSQVGRVAHGQINEDGSFVLSTYHDGDGARPGDYNVSIVSYTPGSGGLEKDRELGLSISDTSAIPEKYNDPKTSGITISVESGRPQTDLTLELTDG